ncbi:hypothetical protein JOF53_006531 [Crossiella equi]|uniref:ParB-like N-terminal domain-containing protein n=2 Tax=Crossiella equi TaxID=130796 RepID=A0ABS5AM69_9PSEU|nr:ParB N-terminal domain-containing protein [Crossiella equi]MBP2477659.1 hypothetical protein [Crossiella equi]
MNEPDRRGLAPDSTSALGDLDAATGDRAAVLIPLEAITATIQVCGVDASAELIDGLATSIDEHGLVHPVEVMPNPGGTWTLIRGNSRLLAHRRLGRSMIAAFIDDRPLTEDTLADVICVQAAENAHRKRLSILETLNTMDRLAEPPCSRGRNAVGRIMNLPETTLKRYWRIYREVRDRRPHWHPAVAAWLNTPEATWRHATLFATNPAAQETFAATGTLPPLPEADPEPDAEPAPSRPSEGGPTGPPPGRATAVSAPERMWRQLNRTLARLSRLRADLAAPERARLRAALLDAAETLHTEEDP